MAQTRAVVFDLYETLITEFSNGSRKFSRAGRDYQALLGLPNHEFKKEWSKRQRKRMTGELPDFYAVMKDMAKTNGFAWDSGVIDALYRQRVQEKSPLFADVLPQITGMLEGLRAQGLKLGLISNCTEEEVQAWESSELPQYFDEVVFSYEPGFAKPDIRIYELISTRLGAAPGECIFVGDGGSDELDGAERAGMTACQAAWFIPEDISSRNTRHPKLVEPSDLFKVLHTK